MKALFLSLLWLPLSLAAQVPHDMLPPHTPRLLGWPMGTLLGSQPVTWQASNRPPRFSIQAYHLPTASRHTLAGIPLTGAQAGAWNNRLGEVVFQFEGKAQAAPLLQKLQAELGLGQASQAGARYYWQTPHLLVLYQRNTLTGAVSLRVQALDVILLYKTTTGRPWPDPISSR